MGLYFGTQNVHSSFLVCFLLYLSVKMSWPAIGKSSEVKFDLLLITRDPGKLFGRSHSIDPSDLGGAEGQASPEGLKTPNGL